MVRVAIDNFGTTEPSASDQLRRFSPVYDVAGDVVPVLYAGDTLACALGETVFHDLPDDPTVSASVLRADLLTLRGGSFELNRDIAVLDLTDAALRRRRKARADVVDTPPARYVDTVAYGRNAWSATEVSGLVWNSRRSADRLSYMFFVDPVRDEDKARALDRRADLTVTGPPLPLHDGEGLAEVLIAASDRGVSVLF
jgi:hypothetical protein